MDWFDIRVVFVVICQTCRNQYERGLSEFGEEVEDCRERMVDEHARTDVFHDGADLGASTGCMTVSARREESEDYFKGFGGFAVVRDGYDVDAGRVVSH